MINKKYKQITTLKQRNHKITQKVIDSNGVMYILKSYPLSQSQSISKEVKVYQTLKQPHLHGFPQVVQGFQWNQRVYLVFQELGSNLEYLRIQCGGRLSLKTVLMISLQLLQRIKFLHKSGFLHGDIKPDNFLVGIGKLKHKIYMVDFELSQSYLIKGKHIAQENTDSFSGSFRFCSRGANSQRNICRKDQIESFYYVLIYLLKGQLPWSNIIANNVSQAYNLIGQLKNTQRKQLLEGLPDLFRKLFINLDQIKFEQQPNYDLIKQSIQNLMKKNGYDLDYKYDWEYLS